MLNILVIHGYVQSAATVAGNTQALKEVLSDIATLHYVDGPPMKGLNSRPWWVLDQDLEHDMTATNRWDDVVKWWSQELSTNLYDGIIGLSQGAAMTALLLSMLNHPENVPGFQVKQAQPIKFAILCSGFISSYEPHGNLYALEDVVPTLHSLSLPSNLAIAFNRATKSDTVFFSLAVDKRDRIVPARKTEDLQKLFKNSKLLSHNEGHAILVRGTWPQLMRTFILEKSV